MNTGRRVIEIELGMSVASACSSAFSYPNRASRSDGNWNRDMLLDALQMPVPCYSRFPITFKAIIHSNDFRPTDHPTACILRDPQGVFISNFYKTTVTWLHKPTSLSWRILKLHSSLCEVQDANDTTRELMIAFYPEWLRRPLGSQLSWPRYMRAFLKTVRSNVITLRYEDMQTYPIFCLGGAVEKLTDAPENPDVIAFSVRSNEFSRRIA